MIVSSDQAVQQLQHGEVVALPTETVYGLAAVINSDEALKKIFEVKKRPFFDPLIVHVESRRQAETLASHWPAIAQILADRFWPGPLTLVVRKNHSVSDVITAGLERVGLRCPRHPIALEIIKKVGVPVAAPSANLFGRTSPTTAQHVEAEFTGQIPVVDGGPCEIGIESTVLLVEKDEMAILRQGHILKKDIETALKNTSFSWKQEISRSESPGHMKHHYMPNKPLFWIESELADLIQTLNQKISEIPEEVEGVKLLKPKKIQKIVELKLPNEATQAARVLYAELRRLTEGPEEALVFRFHPAMKAPEWEPVLERLKKASSLVI